jgi:hypothetical protein
VNFMKIQIIAPVLASIFIICMCIFENKCDFYIRGVFNKQFWPKNFKMAKLQFLLVDRADFDAYRTQSFAFLIFFCYFVFFLKSYWSCTSNSVLPVTIYFIISCYYDMIFSRF